MTIVGILILISGTTLCISACLGLVALYLLLTRRRPKVHPRTVRPRVVYRSNGHRSDVTIERVRR